AYHRRAQAGTVKECASRRTLIILQVYLNSLICAADGGLITAHRSRSRRRSVSATRPVSFAFGLLGHLAPLQPKVDDKLGKDMGAHPFELFFALFGGECGLVPCQRAHRDGIS